MNTNTVNYEHSELQNITIRIEYLNGGGRRVNISDDATYAKSQSQ